MLYKFLLFHLIRNLAKFYGRYGDLACWYNLPLIATCIRCALYTGHSFDCSWNIDFDSRLLCWPDLKVGLMWLLYSG
jgi:hypothetical protein